MDIAVHPRDDMRKGQPLGTDCVPDRGSADEEGDSLAQAIVEFTVDAREPGAGGSLVLQTGDGTGQGACEKHDLFTLSNGLSDRVISLVLHTGRYSCGAAWSRGCSLAQYHPWLPAKCSGRIGEKYPVDKVTW